MSKNYATISRSIVEAIGGGDNVAAVTHCMTRLRFVLNDSTSINSAALKAIPGVMGVVQNDNQCRLSSATPFLRPTLKSSNCFPPGHRCYGPNRQKGNSP